MAITAKIAATILLIYFCRERTSLFAIVDGDGAHSRGFEVSVVQHI